MRKVIGILLAAVFIFIGGSMYVSYVRVSYRERMLPTIGDIRSVISAQRTFSSSNCGFFAELGCLTLADDGEICIPNYPAGAPEYLGGDLARDSPYKKSGTVRKFTPLGVPSELDDSRCAAESVTDYCYSATPDWESFTFLELQLLGPGDVRSFAGTGSGQIYVDDSGDAIPCPIPAGTALLN